MKEDTGREQCPQSGCEGKSGPWRNKEGKKPVKDTRLSVKDSPSEATSAKFSNITSWYRSL